MKIHILFGMIGFILLSGCNRAAEKNPRFYDAGVSRELAGHRKAQIKNLKYELSFNIPRQKEAAIEGDITLRFDLASRQEVLIDFREEREKIKEVIANGVPVDKVRFENEHIILPASSTVEGANGIRIRFTAGNQSLNRNDEYLYTLLVPDRARTVFPCFEQPNLKAEFTLQLELPADWKAVSNTYIRSETVTDDRKTVCFAPTEPLSTYLFSFVAGKLERREYTRDGRTIAAYYRETDPKKVAQLDIVFGQVMASLHWLEEYTGIAYPFAKYDFIVLPGFQFGGMEHTGATLCNDNGIFLSEHPTPDEELNRAELIAHETSHMWFGDLVTMDWFDDVWTKEVFANYFAARIVEPLFPEINHTQNKLKTFTAASLSEDRTMGTNAIRQPLDNLRNAGLIYGQIIYNKAPVMMEKLVDKMGEANFRSGIQEYLKTYSYGNATWDDLIRILDSKTTEDLAAFSDVWVNRKGMPTLTFRTDGQELEIRQHDPYNRGLLWPQRFAVTLCGERDSVIRVNMTDTLFRMQLPFVPSRVLPNTDGRGYGVFVPDEPALHWLAAHWWEIEDDTARQSLLMVLYENYLAKHISADDWVNSLITGLPAEKNALVASTASGYLANVMREIAPANRAEVETRIYTMTQNHPLPSCRIQLMRLFMQNAISEPMVKKLYILWQQQSDKHLNRQDYTTLAYELAIRMPLESEQILRTQRARIDDPDRLRQFDFISRAAVSDTARLDTLFNSLVAAENRRIEPWTTAVIRYLNHPLREDQSVKYIRPGLEVLEEVQRTGDIFFPKNWAAALLGNHLSSSAYEEVVRFLNERPDYSPLLKNKILQAAYPLYRANN